MLHGVNAGVGLYRTAQLHAGTQKVQVEEAFTSIKLKNPPKGVEAELKIPKGSDPKTVINERFDEVIKPKADALAKLEANKTPDNEKAIAELKEELKTLTEGKANAKKDNGFLGIRGFVEKNTGLNNTKATFKRVIRDEPDGRQWYGPKFKQRAIDKLNKNNPEPFDIKNIKMINKSGKSRSIEQKATVEKYLAERAARVVKKSVVPPTPTPKVKVKTKGRPKNNLSAKVTKKQATSLNSSSLKHGGILKAQAGLQLGNLNPKSLYYKAKNPKHLSWNPSSGAPGVFDAKGKYTQEFLNRRQLITPEWFKANQAELQKRITDSGSTYQLTSVDQLLKGTRDYKPGILHDIVVNATTPVEKPAAVQAVTPVTPPVTTSPIVKPVDDNPDVDPSGNN
jgi:hypothetical protein